MRTTLLILFIFGLMILSDGQSTECMKDFDFLVTKIKDDYPGYQDKVTSKTAPELQNLGNEMREKIAAHPDSCGKYLDQYASWFKDNHLRIRGLWPSQMSSSETKPEPRFYSLSPDSIKLLQSKSGSVEGVWTSFWGDLAIIKNPGNEKYLGIAIQQDNYEKNQVMFELTPTDENEFSMVCFPYYNDYKPMKGKMSLRMDKRILEQHDWSRFVRKSDSEIFDQALLYSYLPEFPNGRNAFPLALSLTDSTFYLRATLFMDDATEISVKKHWQEIMARPNLIIDIRNNGGGQDNYYQVLSDLVYTQPFESKGVEFYATADNIKLYEDALKNGDIEGGEEEIEWSKALLAEMKKNKGGFVVHPSGGMDETVTRDTVYTYPKRVGIIINDGDASSAEQFLLEARESKKVTLFGNCNTAGILDYSNAVPVEFPSGKYELNYPMTRSRRLPDHPIDNIGIAPDVIIPYPATEQLFNRIDSWVYFVMNYLELMKDK
jgi:hypothetical protein